MRYAPTQYELAATRIQLFTPKALLVRLERSFDFLSTRARDVPGGSAHPS